MYTSSVDLHTWLQSASSGVVVGGGGDVLGVVVVGFAEVVEVEVALLVGEVDAVVGDNVVEVVAGAVVGVVVPLQQASGEQSPARHRGGGGLGSSHSSPQKYAPSASHSCRSPSPSLLQKQ